MKPSFELLRIATRPSVRSLSRRRFAIPAALLCAAWLAGCGGGGDGGDDGDDGGDGADDDGGDGSDGGEVSFAADIKPVFDAKCVHCHQPNSASMVDLTDPFGEQGIIERENTWVSSPYTLLVDPGNVDNSFILRKVSGDELDPKIEGGPMPLQVEPLTDEELATVIAWVEDGAMEGGPFNAVAEIFGTDRTSLGAAAGKCSWCHPGPQTRMNIVDAFDEENGLVDVPAQLGGVRVVPGDPDNSVLIQKLEGDPSVEEPMPFNPAALSPGEIADLTAWIEDGAPNN